MKDILSALETEYAFAAFDRAGKRLPFNHVFEPFAQALEAQHPWLNAMDGGWFLGNGARVYWDSGEHPEYATPECAGHPRHLVAHVRAGHAIVTQIVEQMANDPLITQIRVWRGNVDYLSGLSWGCHENYLTQRATQALATDLVPHLVSRVVYGGAGGWSPDDPKRFSLSPRLELFQARASADTMTVRGIINTREEDHALAHHRLHLICRDSLTSPLADLLSIGMTRLVVALADMDLKPAGALHLDDDIAALQVFCRDPTCRARVPTNLGRMSAIDIQRHYLTRIDRQRDNLPDWSGEIVTRCAEVLDQLAAEPRDLLGKLDWPTKLVIHESTPAHGVQERLMRDMLLSELGQTLMLDLDTIGEPVVSNEDIENAVKNAPSGTRAEVRGEVIKELSGQPHVGCNWAQIETPNRMLMLEEPYETRQRWRAVDVVPRRRRDPTVPAFLRRGEP